MRGVDCTGYLTASTADAVLPTLREIERRVDAGETAIGYIAYEAASGIAPELVTRPPIDGQPLVAFALFRALVPLDALPPADDPQLPERWESEWDAANHADRVGQIREAIRCGNTYQVNLTWRLRAEVGQDTGWAMFRKLIAKQPVPYAMYLRFPDRFVCSLSPELFFALDGTRITTRPMKGTAPRSSDPQIDRAMVDALAHSEKNRAENVMIVDMLRNDLGRIAHTGTVHVPSLFEVETYATLHQMTSTITAGTSASAVDIFRALFPCASITGAPKVATMRYIAQLEPSPRGVYCGAIGLWEPNRKATFSVGIRTITLDRSTNIATYGIGSGIVWDSVAADEYEECLLKAQLLLSP